ncbi:MAG: hypothetical protein ACETWG_13560 [Candidatus Neomarinimicrobiota bacterium]
MNRNTNRLLAATCVLLVGFMGCELVNTPPSIDIIVEDESPLTGSTQTFTAVVTDLDEDEVLITWSATAGDFSKKRGESVRWTAPLEVQKVVVTAVADDRKAGGIDSAQVVLSVGNDIPLITDFTSSSPYVYFAGSVELACTAYDPDGEDITFNFYTSPYGVGSFAARQPEDNTATWEAPPAETISRTYDLIAEVADEQGYTSRDTLKILVYSEYGTVWIVDSDQQTLSKYTSRGAKVLTSPHSFEEPVAVVNYIQHVPNYYVADREAGEVVKLDALGREVYTYSNIPNVIDLAIHRDTGTLWAISVDSEEPRLTVINTFTNSEVMQIKGLRHPIAIAINQSRNDVWLADIGEGDRIILLYAEEILADPPDSLTAANATIFEGNFNSPSSLFIRNEEDATLYIADTEDNQIERLTYNSLTGNYRRDTPVILPDDAKPIDVVATIVGLVWMLNSGDGTTIEYFDEEDVPTAQPLPFLTSYPFMAPHTMIADIEYGHVWVADNGTHQVVQIVNADSVGVIISGFSFVEDMAINK